MTTSARAWVIVFVCWVAIFATTSAARADRAPHGEPAAQEPPSLAPSLPDETALPDETSPSQETAPPDEAGGSARDLDEPIPEGIFLGRRARRFSLLAGAGFGVQDGGGDSILPELGFYARVSDWVSLGLRVRGRIGVSSIEGARLHLALAMPSVRVHMREDLSSFATLELGVHADGGLAFDWVENRAFGADTLSFGLGAGVYATLELGDISGITLDAWMMAYGLGGTTTSIEMGGTLSYVVRWD